MRIAFNISRFAKKVIVEAKGGAQASVKAVKTAAKVAKLAAVNTKLELARGWKQ